MTCGINEFLEKKEAAFRFTLTNNADTDIFNNIGVCIAPSEDMATAMPRTSVYVKLKSGDTATYTTPTFALADKKTAYSLEENMPYGW